MERSGAPNWGKLAANRGVADRGLMRLPRAGCVVSHGQKEHRGKPEDTADDDELGTLGAVVSVHEEEYDEAGFAGGDDEGDDDVQAHEVGIEVHGGRPSGGDREDHQGREDKEIDRRRNNML